MSEVPEVKLKIAGDLWREWDRIEISSGIEEMIHQVTIDTVDDRKFSGEIFPFEEGDELLVDVDSGLPGGSERVVTGYVSRITVDYGPSHHRITVVGHSKTIDLLESSAPIRRWENVPKHKIADDLCEPFGITVGSHYTMGLVTKFKTEPEETVFDSLVRLAQSEAVLVTTDSEGDVIFTRASTDRISTKLEFGVNTLRGTRVGDYSERGSSYTVISQLGSTKKFKGKDAAQQTYAIADDRVTRHRPMIFLADGKGTQSELERRARHEMHTHMGRSKMVSYDVPDWHHAEGLWKPNELVAVTDDRFWLDDSMLISRVVLQADARHRSEGYIAHLDLARPDSFDILKPPPPATSRKRSWLS